MRFHLLTALAAGAALVQVSASPIRVEIDFISAQPFPPNTRFGHAVANHNNNNNNNVAHLLVPAGSGRVNRRPCGSRFRESLRQKSHDISNALRQALGFPPKPVHGAVRIMPVYPTPIFIPNSNHPGPLPTGETVRYLPHPHPHPHPHGQLYFHNGKAPFLTRVHIALMTLGRWEGRAVAFVLGCGLGVLFRMLWVLGVVSYRLIRGPREENTYSEIILVEEYDSDEESEVTAVPPPPTYTYTDEKADKDKITTEESK